MTCATTSRSVRLSALALRATVTGEAAHEEEVDPNAAWFALAGIIIKETLYRATMSVAKAEKSAVLAASALHHRSDALSSVVALVAIGFSTVGVAIADPIGGLCVAAMIIYQGCSIGLDSIKDLLDSTPEPLLGLDVQNFVASQGLGGDSALKQIIDVPGRAKARKGKYELTVTVAPDTTVQDCRKLEAELERRVKAEFSSVTDLAIRFTSL